MTRTALVLALSMGFSLPAQAVSPGDTCTLTEAIRGSPKTKRWKRRSKVFRAGAQLKVNGRAGRYLKATVDGANFFFKAPALAKFCRTANDDAAIAPDERASTPAPAVTVENTSNAVDPAEEPDAPSEDVFGDTIKIKVGVLDLRSEGLSDEERNALTQTLAETLDGFGPFKTISSQDIASMLQYEAQKQILDCSDESCMAEIGAALGADLLVSGSVVDVGGTWKIQLQLSNIQAGQVEQRASREYSGESSGLFSEVRSAAAILVREILGERSGTLAVSANEVGASVKIDGAIIGVTPIESQELSGGVHTLEVEKTGFVVFKQDVRIQAGKELKVEANLIPSPDFIRAYEADANFTRTMAWVSAGVGVLALGAAGGAYVIGGGEADDLNAEIVQYNQQALRTTAEQQRLADREATIGMWDSTAVVAAGIGVAALATGVVLFITGEDPDRYSNVALEGNDAGFFSQLSVSGGALGFRF